MFSQLYTKSLRTASTLLGCNIAQTTPEVETALGRIRMPGGGVEPLCPKSAV